MLSIIIAVFLFINKCYIVNTRIIAKTIVIANYVNNAVSMHCTYIFIYLFDMAAMIPNYCPQS